jgi:hypothetical protein
MLAPAAQPVAQPPNWGSLRGAAVDGSYVQASAPAPMVEVVSAVGELHPLAIHKLLVLSLFSFGLYEVYWCYRNWSRVRERTGSGISPFWRAFFSPLWGFSLFDEVDDQARAAGVHVGWSPLGLGILFFLLSVLWKLPDPWWLVTHLSCLVLVPVQLTINRMAARRGVRPDASLQVKHVAVIAIGGILWLLVILGTFFPQ